MYPILDPAKLIIEAKINGTGLIPRDYSKEPYGSLSFAAPFDIPLIPRSEWRNRIEFIEKNKCGLTHICDYYKIPVKNQQRTKYCWFASPTYITEVIKVAQGGRYVDLSIASGAAIIKNFRNVGGWGTEAVRFIVERGIVPSSKWPCTAIDSRYNTPENNEERKKYRITEWWDIPPNSFNHLATCLLLNIPVAIGLSWWGHLVTALELTYQNGQFGVIIANSWGSNWGNNGRGILYESKATPNNAVAPRVVIA